MPPDRAREVLLCVVVEAPTWLSTKEAAAYLGINLRTLYRFIDEGELPAYKFGRVIRLRQEELEDFIEQARILPGTLDHLYPEPARPNAS